MKYSHMTSATLKVEGTKGNARVSSRISNTGQDDCIEVLRILCCDGLGD